MLEKYTIFVIKYIHFSLAICIYVVYNEYIINMISGADIYYIKRNTEKRKLVCVTTSA